MTRKTFLIFVLAIVFGLSVAVGINLVLKQDGSGERPDTVTVVVATVDISRATVISAAQVATRELPSDHVPPGVISTVEDAVGRAALTNLGKGDWILARDLAGKNSGAGLAALIPQGMRALTIQTPNVAVGVAGLLIPGNRVDVLLTLTDPSGETGTSGTSAFTILQNVEILAVDQRLEPPPGIKIDSKDLRSVTLLVTPDQAAILDLGRNRGMLHLSLRNPVDQLSANTQPATLAHLRPQKGKPPELQVVAESLKLAPVKPKTHRMTIINGGRVTQEEFSLPEETSRELVGNKQEALTRKDRAALSP